MEFPSKYRKEKQWKSIVIYKGRFLFFNDHQKNMWLNLLLRRLHSARNLKEQTLTLLFITYTIYPSNVPILLCWHQLRSLWAILQYQCDHFLQPQRVECPSKYRKEKQWESIVIYKPRFLFLNPTLVICGWISFKDDYILTQILMKFKRLFSDSDFTLYNIYNLSF